MSFPLSPTNNQQATVNGITYSYSTAAGAWTRVSSTAILVNTGSSLVSGTWTFALSSTGSVTLNGSPFVSGSGTSASGTGTTTTFVISNVTASTGTNSGALQVAGGVGIGGNLTVGGTVTGGGVRTTTTSTVPSNAAVGDLWYNTSNDVIYRYTYDGTNYYWIDTNGPNNGFFGLIAGTDIAVDLVTISNISTLQSVTSRGGSTSAAISITNTSSSTSTTTGALVITGGVGIGSNLYVSGAITATNMYVSGAITATNMYVSGAITATNMYVSGAITATNMYVSGAITATNMYVSGAITATNMYVSGAITATNMYVNGYAVSTSTGGVTASGTGTTTTFVISNSTQSTGTNTGALTVSGGVGVAGNLVVGGITILQQAQEVMVPVNSPGVNPTLNFNQGAVFYVTNMTSNFTATYINVPTSANYVYATTLILAQTATNAYTVANVRVNGTAQTIRWLGGSTATVTANRTDVISVTLVATGTNAYTVLASGGEYY